MKTRLIRLIFSIAPVCALISCGKTPSLIPAASLVVSIDETSEYARPLARISLESGAEIESFYPCSILIDGTVCTTLGVGLMTVLNKRRTHTIALPRLCAGEHRVDFVFGKPRSLYRDAEAACGEESSVRSCSLTVEPSSRSCLALKSPVIDLDRYVFYPDEESEGEILSGTYTLDVFPEGDFSIGECYGTIASKTETSYGMGITVSCSGTSFPEPSWFILSFGGREMKLYVR